MANGLFGGGKGTLASPYLIEDLLDFIAMIKKAPSYDNNFKVVNDIDASLESLEAVGLGNGGNGWVCIPFSFQVYVDFNFKKLSNLYMKTDGLACPFGNVAGRFKNFIFENFDITSTSGDAFGLFSGSSQFRLIDGKISGFKVKAEKNASLISGVAKDHYFQGIYIENSHVESKEKASFFISETVIVLNDSQSNSVQFNVISNSSLKSKICRGLGDGKGSMTWVPGGDEPCFNRSNVFLNCKFMGTEINTITDFLPYGQTAIKNYVGPNDPPSSIFSFGSTLEGPHSDELYDVAYLTETQAKTASTYGTAFNNTWTKIVAEDGSFPYFYLDTSPTFPAEVKTATGKDGSTNDPEVFNTAIAYALDFNNWWIIDEGLSTPYKPSFYVKEVGSCVPLPVKSLTGKDGLDISPEAALAEISYQLDFNNWWAIDEGASKPYKPNYFVKDIGSIFPAFVNSLTSKDGLSITEEESEKKSTYAFDWNNTPFVIYEGLKSPDMNYFDGSIIIEIPSGKYSKSIATGIKCSVFEKVLYTTDGTEPNSESNMVDSGFKVKISESCTLKARAYSKVFIGGSYQEFMGDIVSETYYISFKSVYDRITSRLKFEESCPVEAYFDKDVDGNLFVMLAKNSDDVMSVQRNGDEISEYFSDASMKDYDFSTEEENVYTMYDEFGNFICSVKPSKITSIDDNSDDILSEVSDTFLDLYSSFEDIGVIKKYVKGYRDVYEFINSVVKLKKIKECIDEDLSVIDEIGEVASSLKSRKNKLREINSVDLNILEIERIEEPSIEINTTYKDLMMGVDLKNG